jgi:transcriptional regulatory protein GAL4
MSEDVVEFYSACDCCRSRKYKVRFVLSILRRLSKFDLQCTKEKPTCAPCLQLGLECSYSKKISRTPLTRNNLTAAEDRIRDLEKAIKVLFPGVDIETVLSSTIRSSEKSRGATDSASSPSNKLSPSSREASHEAETTAESLPQAADGFDWTENAVSLNQLADGMAALSVNPEGAGYLGKFPAIYLNNSVLNDI